MAAGSCIIEFTAVKFSVGYSSNDFPSSRCMNTDSNSCKKTFAQIEIARIGQSYGAGRLVLADAEHDFAFVELPCPRRLYPDNFIEMAGVRSGQYPVLDAQRVEQLFLFVHVIGRHVFRYGQIRMRIEMQQNVAVQGQVLGTYFPVDVTQRVVVVVDDVDGHRRVFLYFVNHVL
ncbi:hypothetical protein AGLY_015633 [Aphis glycines]|uniref:Uncharacterized protein n=1 Tax=Aphis glycines TaxID=307491 RepID=A0A6G0T023_APHGL|nr:hypothetical protein AGLY_015633 [Aphis glycines]